MASFKDHCRESIELFGKPYEEVHKWLDEYFHAPVYGTHHRRKRHHLAGINEARRLFNAEAAKAAERHVLTDLKDENGQKPETIPRDEDDYVRKGY